MLKLGLVQVNFQAGPVNLNAFYLPYTVGILWAYARQNKTVADNYQVHYWGFRRDPIDQQAKAVAECDVAFFSFYVWVLHHHTFHVHTFPKIMLQHGCGLYSFQLVILIVQYVFMFV